MTVKIVENCNPVNGGERDDVDMHGEIAVIRREKIDEFKLTYLFPA